MTTFQRVSMCGLMFLVALLATMYGLQKQSIALAGYPSNCYYPVFTTQVEAEHFAEWAREQETFSASDIVMLMDNQNTVEICPVI